MKIKKVLSIFLAALMVFSMFPMSVFAESNWVTENDTNYLDVKGGTFAEGELYNVIKANLNSNNDPTKITVGNQYTGYKSYDWFFIKESGKYLSYIDVKVDNNPELVNGSTYDAYIPVSKSSLGSTRLDYNKIGSFTVRFTADKESQLVKNEGTIEVKYIPGQLKATIEANIFDAVVASSIPEGLTAGDVTIEYKSTSVVGIGSAWYEIGKDPTGMKAFGADFSYENGKTETVRITYATNNEYTGSVIETEITLVDGRTKYTPVVADIPALSTKTDDIDATIKAAFSVPGLTANDYTFTYEQSLAIAELPYNVPTDVTFTYTVALKDTTNNVLTTDKVTKVVAITNEVTPATINVTKTEGGTVTLNGENAASIHAFTGKVTVVVTPDAGYYVSAIDGVELVYGDNRSVTYTLEVENEKTYAVNVTFAKSGLVKNEGVLEVPFIIGQSKATSEAAIFAAVVNSGASIPAGLKVSDVKIEYKSTSVVGIGSAWYEIGSDPTGMKAFSRDFTYADGATEKVRITYAANSIYDSSVIETEIKLTDGRADASVNVSDATIGFKNKDEALAKAVSAITSNGGAVTVTDITGLPTAIGETAKAVVSYTVAETNGVKGTSGTAEISFKLLETPGTLSFTWTGSGDVLVSDSYYYTVENGAQISSGTYEVNAYPLGNGENIPYIKSVKVDGEEISDTLTYRGVLAEDEEGADFETYFYVTFDPATEVINHTIEVEFAERALVSLGANKEISYVAGAGFDSIKSAIFSTVVDVAKSVGVSSIDDVTITTEAADADLVEGAKIDIVITAKATDRYPETSLSETVVITYNRGDATINVPDALGMNLAASADGTAAKIEEYLRSNITVTSGADLSFEIGAITLPKQGETVTVAVVASAAETDLYKAASATFEVELYGEIKDAVFTGVAPVIANGAATLTVTPADDEYIDFITVNGVAENITTRSHTVTITKLNGAGDALDAAAPAYELAYELKKFAPAINENAVIGFNPDAEINDTLVNNTVAAIKNALGVGDNATVKFYQDGVNIGITTLLEGYIDLTAYSNIAFRLAFGTNVEKNGTDTESIQVTIPENGKYPAYTKEVTITLEDSRAVNLKTKDGSIEYCADKNIDSKKLKLMVLNAVLDKENTIPANLQLRADDPNVVIEFKPVGVSLGDYGWYNIEEKLSININIGNITHNFGQEGTEKIRIKYTDADGVTYTSNEATLTVIDTCYNVTISGLDSKSTIKTAADITVEKNGLYKEKTEYTVVVTPNVLSKEFVADIIVKDANGNRVNGAISYNQIDITSLESINAKTSFTTVANGVYTVEIVYGTAEIKLTDETVVFDKYDSVDGKYDAVVPTVEEVFNALMVSASPEFMATYSSKHTVKFTVNLKEVELKDVADGTTVTVTISYDNDGVQYQDVSATAKIKLVDPRTATSIETEKLTEAVRFVSEDQLKEILKDALKAKVLAGGKELADAEYDLTVGEIKESDGKNYVDVTINYYGNNAYKPSKLVLNNVEVTDIPEKTFVNIVSDGATVLFNGKSGSSFEVTGNVSYEVKATPRSGYAIESIIVTGDDDTTVVLTPAYKNQIATAKFTAAEHVNYTVTVTSAQAKFDLAEDAKVPFRTGADVPDVKVIYDAAVEAPARSDKADIKVLYLAREASNLEINIPSFTIAGIEIPGRTLEIPLSETWLEVGEEITNVTLEDITSDYTNVQYLKYYGAKEFGADGDGSTERIKISYEDAKWLIGETETTVTIVDSRKVTEITSLDSAAVKYGATGADVANAFNAVVTADGAEIDGEIICKTNVDGLDVGEYEVVLAFAGNDEYRPCEKTVKLKIEKAPVDVIINSQVVAFGEEIDIAPVTDPAGVNTIDFVIGVDVKDDIEGYVQLRLPGKLGEYFEGEMSLPELADNLKSIAGLGDDLLDGLGFDSTTVNYLVDAITAVAEGLDLPNLTIKVNGDIVPDNIGAYIVGAVTADSNYETAVNAGYLVITPATVEVELDWLVDDENGIITLSHILNGEYDLGATVVKNDLSDVDWQLANEAIKYVFVGVNLEGELIASREPIAQNGAYAELAYVLDWGNELFYSMPIARAFLIAPETADVVIIDENGTENRDRIFTYDGTAHSVDAVAFDAAGEAFSAEKLSENLSIHYYGMMNDGTTYDSADAPVNAGAYTAIATYIEKDAEGNYIYFGMDAAAIAILPAESEVAVESDFVIYDGEKHSLDVTTAPEGLDYILITAGINLDYELVNLSNVVNVDFPERVDELLVKYLPEAYRNGVELYNVTNTLETLEGLLAKVGVESEQLDLLTNNLSVFPENAVVTFKDQSEAAPSAVGAYMMAAIVCDPNYVPSIDAGLLTVVPALELTNINWNEIDENGIFTVEKAKNFDFGATAEAENAPVGTLFVGINADDLIYISNEATDSVGSYTETAYINGIGSVSYVAMPIMRSYVIVPATYTVKFVDETGNENNERLFEYDGTAKSMSAVAYDMAGNVLSGGEMAYTYIGMEGDFEIYRSTEAPVNAGAYRVIATYTERDADGKLLGIGSTTGVMVIRKTELNFGINDTTVIYDGKGHFAEITSDIETDYLAAIYGDGVLNIVFPEDMQSLVDLIPSKAYTAATVAEEIAKLADKAANDKVKTALNKLASYIAQYGDAGVVINGELPSQVGSYEIATICVAENYITDLSEGTLTIVPKDVTITIDNASKTEGEDDPALTFNVSGLVNGERIENIVVSRESGEEPGEYAITATYTANKNYNVTVVGGIFTINEAVKEEVEYLYGRSLLFRDIIKIRYYYDFTEFAGEISDTGLFIWSEEEYNKYLNNELTTAPYEVKGLAQRADNKNIYYGESDGIPAKNMIDKQFAMAYVVLKDGTTVYTEVCEFSPVMYAQIILAPESTQVETMKNLAATLMNYGAAAQLHFGYKTETLMNDWMDADRKTVSFSEDLIQALPSFDAAKFALTNDTTVRKAGSSLTFVGNIKQNFYFDVQNSAIDNASEMKVLYWTESEYNAYTELTAENAHKADLVYDAENSAKAGINCYRAVFGGVSAKDLRDAFVVAVYYKDAQGNDHYSQLFADGAHDYVRRVISSNSTEAMKNLAKAFLVYHLAAEDHLIK